MIKASFIKLTVIALLTTLFLLSCANNNELDLYGVVPCDIKDVTWNSKISEIMQANCVMCHNEEIHYNGVRHDNYASEMIVVNDGRLRGVVNHLDGYVKMPKDRGKLPACELQLINIWLDNGAPEF
jgi:hypothetical protein